MGDGMSRGLQILFAIYFVTHIPVTICIDGQAAFPKLYPRQLRDVLDWYCENFNDILMDSPPEWFRIIVMSEIFLQLPFFPVASYAFIFRKNWIRLPILIYASHVVTTLILILTTFAWSQDISFEQKATLYSIYSPYLLVPLLLIVVMLVYGPTPFGTSSGPPTDTKKKGR